MRMIMVPATILVVSIVCYSYAYAYVMPSALWLGFIASFVLAALGFLRSPREANRLLILLAFVISMRIPSLLQTRSWGFAYPMVDSALDLTLSNLIRESGKWSPGMGFEVIRGYSYYPVVHIWTAISSNVMGMDTALLARIFPFLTGSLVTMFFYLAVRKILSKEVAIWGSLMYNLNGSLHFWEYFVREFMALVFFSMCLYAVFSMYRSREDRGKFFVLGSIAAFMTVSSHHWTSYNMVAILVVLTVFPVVYARIHAWLMNLRARRKYPISVSHESLITPSFLLITSLLVISWTLYIGYTLFTIHARQFLDFFINVITPSPNFVEHPMPGFTFSMKVLLYLGYLVLGLLGVAELVRQLFNRQKTYDDSIVESWFIFSGFYIFAATFLLPSGSGWWVISWRSWSFAFFGLVPLGAVTITRMLRWNRKSARRQLTLRRLAPLILVFPLISAVLTAPPEIISPAYPRGGDSFYGTALWVRQHLPNETIALDPWSRSVIIPYGRAVTFPALRWPGRAAAFLDTLYGFQNFSDSTLPAWETVVFNRRISEWIPNASADSSVLDLRYDRTFDSGALTIYIIALRD